MPIVAITPIFQFSLSDLLVLTGGAAGVSAFVSKLIFERVTQTWKLEADKKLESIRGEIGQNNSIVQALLSQQGQHKQKALENQIEAVKTVWDCVQFIKSHIPPDVALLNDVFTVKELESGIMHHVANGSSYALRIREVNIMAWANPMSENMEKVHKVRPFISSNLFMLVYVYNGVLGRMVHHACSACYTGEMVIWSKDAYSNELLESVLQPNEIEFLHQKAGFKGFSTIVDLMEQKILNETARILSFDTIEEDVLGIIKAMSKIRTTSSESD